MTFKAKLYELVKNNRIDLIEELLDVGLDTDSIRNLIYAAIKFKNKKPIEIFINANVILDSQDEEGITPLMIAIKENDIEIARVLMEGRTDLELSDNYNNTALMYAIAYEMPEIADLIREKIKVIKSIELWALCCSTDCRFNIDYVSRSVDNRLIDINYQGENGITPLMGVIMQNHIGLVQHFIRRGVDLNIQDDAGKTALDYAIDHNYEKIITLIKRKQLENEINENAKNRQEEK